MDGYSMAMQTACIGSRVVVEGLLGHTAQYISDELSDRLSVSYVLTPHPLSPPPPLPNAQARDPIPQLKRVMLEQGLATEDDIKAIHDK
jgi:hypothetical protein